MPKYASIAEALEDSDLFASAALLILVDQFGVESMDWDPETINTELAERYSIDPSKSLMDRINAALALVTTDLYYRSLEAFTTINEAFANGPVSATTFNINSLEEVMFGLTEARLLEGGEEFDQRSFSHDISRYVGKLLADEGLARTPKIMKFAEFAEREADERNLALSADLVAAEAFWRRNDDSIGDLEELAMARLDQLFQQVEALPLTNRAQTRSQVATRIKGA